MNNESVIQTTPKSGLLPESQNPDNRGEVDNYEVLCLRLDATVRNMQEAMDELSEVVMFMNELDAWDDLNQKLRVKFEQVKSYFTDLEILEADMADISLRQTICSKN